MGYDINFSRISIDRFKDDLKKSALIPSWRILHENIDTIFEIIKGNHIENMDQLLQAIRTKKRIQTFKEQTGIDEKYLTILSRMIRGFIRKPNAFNDFPCLPNPLVKNLEACGYVHTKSIYSELLHQTSRDQLMLKCDLSRSEMLRIAHLTDISRIRWVSPKFACILIHCGYDSIEKIKCAEPDSLHEAVHKSNVELKTFKGQIGLNDIKLLIESASYLDQEIRY